MLLSNTSESKTASNSRELIEEAGLSALYQPYGSPMVAGVSVRSVIDVLCGRHGDAFITVII